MMGWGEILQISINFIMIKRRKEKGEKEYCRHCGLDLQSPPLAGDFGLNY
jgi:hypothetical protein